MSALRGNTQKWETNEFGRLPPVVHPFASWLGKKIALQHVREAAPAARQEGLFDNVEGDVQEGAKFCLQFLAQTLGGGSAALGSGSLERISALGAPYLEARLGEQLKETVIGLRQHNYDWRWQLEDPHEASLQRLFVVFGASRTGARRRGSKEMVCMPGQQFVLTSDQMKRFKNKDVGMMSRLNILQELLEDDMVFVADVAVKTRQRVAVWRPGVDSDAELSEPRESEHVLRMEMTLSQDRSASEDNDASMRPSSWQLCDWNWVCLGNHPALEKGVAAPW